MEKSVVLQDLNHASKWNTPKWLSQTWRKCQMQSGSGGALWMECEARWDLFANNSLGCWAVFLTLTRIWQVGQSRCFGFFWKSVCLHSWRLNLGWCLYFHRHLLMDPEHRWLQMCLFWVEDNSVSCLAHQRLVLLHSSAEGAFGVSIPMGNQEHGSSRPDFYTNVLSPQGFIWKGNNLKIALT